MRDKMYDQDLDMLSMYGQDDLLQSVVVAEGTAEEVNGVKVEMIETLRLTIPSVVLGQSDSWVLTVTGTRLS
jgi:hypothetical protein